MKLPTDPLTVINEGHPVATILLWGDLWCVSIGGKQFTFNDQDQAVAFVMEPAFSDLAASLTAFGEKLRAEEMELAKTRSELLAIERRLESLKQLIEQEAA